MKKNTLLSLFEIRPLTILAITFAALVLSRPAFATPTPIHTIDITENSSTSLTVLYDLNNVTASVVKLNSPDNWTLTFDPSIQFTTFTLSGWEEPDNPPGGFFGNVVGHDPTLGSAPNQLFVISDILTGSNPFPNGSKQSEFGTVNGQQVEFDITFRDNGDAPVGRVPESGSTLALFFLSLAALLGASRLRSGRFA